MLVGIGVAAFLPLVYLPLLESSDLAVRSTGALFENSGKLRPTAGDLLARARRCTRRRSAPSRAR